MKTVKRLIMLENDSDFDLIDLTFSEMPASLKVGETMQLSIIDGNILADEISYYSSDPKIATVTAEGMLTANSIGAVKITVKTASGENSIILDIIVNDENASEVRYLLLDVNDEVILSPNDHDCFIGNNSFVFTSSDEDVVRVDETGHLDIRGSGFAKITISSEGTDVIYYTSISRLIQDVKINSMVINLKKGGIFNLNVAIYPDNAANKVLSYYSSDSEIAEVNSNGRIIAKRNGTAIITVKTNDGSGIVKKVAVNVSRTKVSCPFYELGLMVNKQFRLRCSVDDNSILLYSSSDENIATVDSSGTVYPKKWRMLHNCFQRKLYFSDNYSNSGI